MAGRKTRIAKRSSPPADISASPSTDSRSQDIENASALRVSITSQVLAKRDAVLRGVSLKLLDKVIDTLDQILTSGENKDRIAAAKAILDYLGKPDVLVTPQSPAQLATVATRGGQVAIQLFPEDVGRYSGAVEPLVDPGGVRELPAAPSQPKNEARTGQPAAAGGKPDDATPKPFDAAVTRARLMELIEQRKRRRSRA